MDANVDVDVDVHTLKSGGRARPPLEIMRLVVTDQGLASKPWSTWASQNVSGNSCGLFNPLLNSLNEADRK